ncbi:hypothetical protein QG053_10535, partial [Kingella kingae]|uniref:hypothetical protein n=1 Tax=Kingella kingae TaxID=504 RepID=UPI00254C7BAF
IKGFKEWQKDKDRQEALYWQQECALLEYENQFMRQLSQRLIPRLVNRFGADFQDYLIMRHSGLTPPEQPQELPPKKSISIHVSPRIPTHDSKPVAKPVESERIEQGYSWDEINKRTEAILAKRRAEKREQERKERERQEALQQQKEKVFVGKPSLQAPIARPIRNRLALLPYYNSDDLLDVDFRDVQETEDDDNYFSGTASRPQQAQRVSMNKGGRPRKYNSAAERQAAYRARKKAI